MLHRNWRPTDLSVRVCEQYGDIRDWRVQTSEGTVLDVSLDAGEAIDSATCELREMDQDTIIQASVDLVVEGTIATITVEDLVRGYAYLAVVRFVATVGNPFERTLVIECVA